MTFRQELSSWWSPSGLTAAEAPKVGAKAPTTPKLGLSTGQPTVIAFLRHCGCPFAEKTFLNLRDIAKAESSINFIAVSHSDRASTDSWLKSLPQAGSEPSNLSVVVDAGSEIYGAWGLGVAGYAHVLDPRSLYQGWRLGKDEGIWNRPTESGSRWQTSGTFAVDRDGIVRWGGPAWRADQIPDLKAAVQSVQSGTKATAKL